MSSTLTYTVALPAGASSGTWELKPEIPYFVVGSVGVVSDFRGDINSVGKLVAKGGGTALVEVPASGGSDAGMGVLRINFNIGAAVIPGLPIRVQLVESTPGDMNIATLLNSQRGQILTPQQAKDLDTLVNQTKAAKDAALSAAAAITTTAITLVAPAITNANTAAATALSAAASISAAAAGATAAAGLIAVATYAGIPGADGYYRVMTGAEASQVYQRSGGTLTRRPDLEAAPKSTVDALQTSRTALVAGSLSGLPVGTRLLDEYGPLRLRVPVGAEVADNGSTYAVGSLIAEREDDGSPALADWYAIPENVGGQTARWQAAVDGAFRRMARLLEVGKKNYVLDGVVTTKASISAPEAQFTVPVGNAASFTGKFVAVSEVAGTLYSDAPHLFPTALNLTAFTPGLDALTDRASIIPALASMANQQLTLFSSVPSTHRMNGLYDQTYERQDCVVPDASGQLNVPLAFDYAYPAAALSAAAWSSSTVYKRGDYVKRTVGGTSYLFVATYPSGPGTTLHTTSAAIGAVTPDQTLINTLGTEGVRLWMQLYRNVTVTPRQRPLRLHLNITVSGTHSTLTNVTLNGVLGASGRPDVSIKGIVVTDNVNTRVDNLVSVANIAGLQFEPGSRFAGSTYPGLGYNILGTNCSRVTLSGIVSSDARHGYSSRHGNTVAFHDSELCVPDEHYGTDYYFDNCNLTTADANTYVYAMLFSGRDLTVTNTRARHALAVISLRNDSAMRGGRITLDNVTLFPSGSSSNSGLLYGTAVGGLAADVVASGFSYVVPWMWPEVVQVKGCHVAPAADGTNYAGNRFWVDFAMDTTNVHVPPRKIVIENNTVGHPSEYISTRLRYYGIDTSKFTQPTKISIVNSKSVIAPWVRPLTGQTQADVDTAWAAYSGDILKYDVSSSTVALSPTLSLPATYLFHKSQVETWTATGSDLPASAASRVAIQALSSTIGATGVGATPAWGVSYALTRRESRFVDCDFLKGMQADWVLAAVVEAGQNRVATYTNGTVATGVPGAISGTRRRLNLPANTTSSPAWIRAPRLNSTNPVTSTDWTSLNGTLTMQPNRSAPSLRQYRAEFGFGGVYSSALATSLFQFQPVLEEVGLPSHGVQWQIIKTSDGWNDLYIKIPQFTPDIVVEYDLYMGSEPSGTWAYSDPPVGSTVMWDSTVASNARQPRNGGAVYVQGSQLLTTRQAAIADTSGATLTALETEVNKLKAMLRVHGLIG